MIRLLSSRLYLLILVSFFTACHHIPKISDYPIEGDLLLPHDAEKVSTDIARKGNQIESLRMLSRCELSADKTHFAYRYAFVVERRKGLRIEQLPLSGFYALATLVSTDNKTTVVFPSEKQAYIFLAGTDGLKTLLGFSLPFTEADIGIVLAGNLPERFLNQTNEYRLSKNSVAVTLRNEELIATFSPEHQIQEAHFFSPADGNELIALHFEYDEERLPVLLSLYVPEYQVTLNCRALQRGTNIPIKEGVFTVNIPGGYAIRRSN